MQPASAPLRRVSSQGDGGGDAVVDPEGLRSVEKEVQDPASGTQFKRGELLHQGQQVAGAKSRGETQK